MSERRGFSIAVHFIVRAICGYGSDLWIKFIFGISADSGCGRYESGVAFDIRNPWNSWGCAPLCDFVLSNFVRLSQS